MRGLTWLLISAILLNGCGAYRLRPLPTPTPHKQAYFVCGEGCGPGGGPDPSGCDETWDGGGTCEYSSSEKPSGFGSYEWFYDVIQHPTAPCYNSASPIACSYVAWGNAYGFSYVGLPIVFVPTYGQCLAEQSAQALAAAASLFYAAQHAQDVLRSNPRFAALVSAYAAGELGAIGFISGFIGTLGPGEAAALAITVGFTLYELYKLIACASHH